jgi:hypothetical protein
MRIIVEKLLPIACTVGVASPGETRCVRCCTDKAVTMCGREIFVIEESRDGYKQITSHLLVSIEVLGPFGSRGADPRSTPSTAAGPSLSGVCSRKTTMSICTLMCWIPGFKMMAVKRCSAL